MDRSYHNRRSTFDMAASLVPLHVAPYAEGFSTAAMRAFEGLLAGMRMAVDSQRAWSTESLVAGLANVAILRLREGSSR